jgi:small-conductance mechanosensitive channel
MDLFNPETWEKLIVPVGFIASGFIVGFIFERIFLLQIKKVAIKSRWESGRMILNAFKNITFLWFILAGIYFALLNSEGVGPKTTHHIRIVLAVLSILSVTILVSKLATGFVKLYTGSVLPSTSIFINLTKIFVFIIGMLVLLQTIGISITPILTALGVGGLAVALALQDTLSNLFAGLHIIASKKIKPGDYLKLENGQEGILEDITWRNTSIKTPLNNTVIIPNSKMASSIVTNFNLPTKELVTIVPLAVSYNTDIKKLEAVTIEVAEQAIREVLNGREADFKPFIRFTSFGESSLNFEVTMKVKELGDQGILKHEFLKRVYDRYKKESIEIPHPIRMVHMKNSDK